MLFALVMVMGYRLLPNYSICITKIWQTGRGLALKNCGNLLTFIFHMWIHLDTSQVFAFRVVDLSLFFILNKFSIYSRKVAALIRPNFW
jgi:hypothetical protein